MQVSIVTEHLATTIVKAQPVSQSVKGMPVNPVDLTLAPVYTRRPLPSKAEGWFPPAWINKTRRRSGQKCGKTNLIGKTQNELLSF